MIGALKAESSCHSEDRFDFDKGFDITSEDYGIGYTYNGEKFLFDKEDLSKIMEISSCWNFNDGGYLAARDKRDGAERYSNGARKFVYIKDIIMNKQQGEIFK